MSKEHNHDHNCDCAHHDPEGSSHDENNPCPTELFVENLLKDLEKEKDSED